MWVQNILEIYSDNSEVLFFVENNKKIKNKCTKNEKVLSQLSFEQTVPINFQDSKQKWKTEQYKQRIKKVKDDQKHSIITIERR